MTTTPAKASEGDPSAGPQVVMRGESHNSSKLTEIGVQNNLTGRWQRCGRCRGTWRPSPAAMPSSES